MWLSTFGYVGDAKMCFYMLFPLVPPNVVKGIIYIYILYILQMVRIWGMMGWWVSVEAQWGQNMRQKEGWFFWLEMSTGWHAKRWRTNSFSKVESGPVEGWLSFSKVEETRSWQMLAPGCVTRLWRDSSRRFCGTRMDQVSGNHERMVIACCGCLFSSQVITSLWEISW